jgi:hypothetical protein
METIILIVIAFIAGGVCGYLLRRNSPQTSAKIDSAYSKTKDKVTK